MSFSLRNLFVREEFIIYCNTVFARDHESVTESANSFLYVINLRMEQCQKVFSARPMTNTLFTITLRYTKLKF